MLYPQDGGGSLSESNPTNQETGSQSQKDTDLNKLSSVEKHAHATSAPRRALEVARMSLARNFSNDQDQSHPLGHALEICIKQLRDGNDTPESLISELQVYYGDKLNICSHLDELIINPNSSLDPETKLLIQRLMLYADHNYAGDLLSECKMPRSSLGKSAIETLVNLCAKLPHDEFLHLFHNIVESPPPSNEYNLRASSSILLKITKARNISPGELGEILWQAIKDCSNKQSFPRGKEIIEITFNIFKEANETSFSKIWSLYTNLNRDVLSFGNSLVRHKLTDYLKKLDRKALIRNLNSYVQNDALPEEMRTQALSDLTRVYNKKEQIKIIEHISSDAAHVRDLAFNILRTQASFDVNKTIYENVVVQICSKDNVAPLSTLLSRATRSKSDQKSVGSVLDKIILSESDIDNIFDCLNYLRAPNKPAGRQLVNFQQTYAQLFKYSIETLVDPSSTSVGRQNALLILQKAVELESDFSCCLRTLLKPEQIKQNISIIGKLYSAAGMSTIGPQNLIEFTSESNSKPLGSVTMTLPIELETKLRIALLQTSSQLQIEASMEMSKRNFDKFTTAKLEPFLSGLVPVNIMAAHISEERTLHKFHDQYSGNLDTIFNEFIREANLRDARKIADLLLHLAPRALLGLIERNLLTPNADISNSNAKHSKHALLIDEFLRSYILEVSREQFLILTKRLAIEFPNNNSRGLERLSNLFLATAKLRNISLDELSQALWDSCDEKADSINLVTFLLKAAKASEDPSYTLLRKIRSWSQTPQQIDAASDLLISHYPDQSKLHFLSLFENLEFLPIERANSLSYLFKLDKKLATWEITSILSQKSNRGSLEAVHEFLKTLQTSEQKLIFGQINFENTEYGEHRKVVMFSNILSLTAGESFDNSILENFLCNTELSYRSLEMAREFLSANSSIEPPEPAFETSSSTNLYDSDSDLLHSCESWKQEHIDEDTLVRYFDLIDPTILLVWCERNLNTTLPHNAALMIDYYLTYAGVAKLELAIEKAINLSLIGNNDARLKVEAIKRLLTQEARKP